MKLKDITPKALQCGIAACPAIYETDRGTYIIIGKRVDTTTACPPLADALARGEVLAEIPRDLLQGISESTKHQQ